MSDVKAFTGFIAVDGSTHSSLTAAVAHSREVKIKAALKDKFGSLNVVIDGEQVQLDEFINKHRDDITAALNQEVLTRKKRAPNKPRIEGAKPAQAPAVAALA